MFPAISVIFLLVSVLEIYLLIQVGDVIGAPWTILLVVLTAIIGVKLIKIQGIATLIRTQNKLQTKQLPAQEILEGIALIVSGAFLLTPGFFTDSIGFMLLIPTIRIWLVSKIAARLITSGSFVQTPYNSSSAFDTVSPKNSENGNIIEGVNYTRED